MLRLRLFAVQASTLAAATGARQRGQRASCTVTRPTCTSPASPSPRRRRSPRSRRRVTPPKQWHRMLRARLLGLWRSLGLEGSYHGSLRRTPCCAQWCTSVGARTFPRGRALSSCRSNSAHTDAVGTPLTCCRRSTGCSFRLLYLVCTHGLRVGACAYMQLDCSEHSIWSIQLFPSETLAQRAHSLAGILLTSARRPANPASSSGVLARLHGCLLYSRAEGDCAVGMQFGLAYGLRRADGGRCEPRLRGL